MIFGRNDNTKIRPARLDDSQILSRLQNDYSKKYNLIDTPKSAEKIRLSIGKGLLHHNNYFVIEDENNVIGFIQQKKHNSNHVLIGYPYVDLNHSERKKMQINLLKESLKKLKSYGFKYASARISLNDFDGEEIFLDIGFKNPQPILQIYGNRINPNPQIDIAPYEIRRVKADDLELTYKWIERQLNPMSPLYLSKDGYKRLLNAPNKVREGWAIAERDGVPKAMVSSMIDNRTGSVIVFGPFNHPSDKSARIPLLNELLLFHKLKGREEIRIMRIEQFDNDKELMSTFNFKKKEQIKIITKKL